MKQKLKVTFGNFEEKSTPTMTFSNTPFETREIIFLSMAQKRVYHSLQAFYISFKNCHNNLKVRHAA